MLFAPGAMERAGGGGTADRQVDAQAADHLPADTLDSHQLVDGAERMPLSVPDDAAHLGRSDAR
jgi:hypothetical protein